MKGQLLGLARLISVLPALSLPVASWARARVVTPVHPTWEVVVADDVMESSGRGVDATPEIQRRLDALAAADGGTLFLKAGFYRVATPLVLPPNVMLKGDYGPTDASGSTVLEITCGRGEENGVPAVQLNAGSGLQGLHFHYPEQSLAHPVPYPWTVANALKPVVTPEHQTLRDCTFVNSWKAISIGPHWNELHTLLNVRICALRTGIFVDTTTDTGRMEDVSVSPRFWSESGLPEVPAEVALRDYLQTHGTVGVIIARSDWENVWKVSVDGYHVGCRYEKGARGCSNAVMSECAFVKCGTGIEIDALNGVGLGVYDARFEDCCDSVRATTNFQTVVQLLDCDFGGKGPVNDGGPLSSFLVRTKEGPRVRHCPMTWPRPRGESLFIVTDYGASPTNADNSVAFAAALADARASGGTVYVPGGRYDFRHGLTVPSGVELRGNAATPHHTVSGGTTLMVRCGKGEECGTPFLQLEAGAGVRGLSFWYPENPVKNPVSYPWTVRSLGPGCWVADVNMANTWQGVDFLSNPSDGHRIAYLSGNAWRRGLFVGNSQGPGWVENTQFNPHYAKRLPKGLPFEQGKAPPEFPVSNAVGGESESHWMRKMLEAHVFKDCADERILSTLVYAACDGISFRGKNKATLVIHGTDTGARCMEIAQMPESRLYAALCQLTPCETLSGKESAAVHFAREDRGKSLFNVCQVWVRKPTVIGEGLGVACFRMGNSLAGPAYLRRGNFRFTDFHFSEVCGETFQIASGVEAKLSDSGDFVYSKAPRPKSPPVNLTVDFDQIRPSEDVVGRYGSIREASAWQTRICGRAYRFRAELKNVPHANVYAEFLKDVQIPVFVDTTVSYQIRPLSKTVAKAGQIAFDFHFTDGSLMRTSPNPSWPGQVLKVGEWNDVRYRLRGSAGKTIDYIMLRVDVRNRPAEVYEAEFDSIRIETRKN